MKGMRFCELIKEDLSALAELPESNQGMEAWQLKEVSLHVSGEARGIQEGQATLLISLNALRSVLRGCA